MKRTHLSDVVELDEKEKIGEGITSPLPPRPGGYELHGS